MLTPVRKQLTVFGREELVDRVLELQKENLPLQKISSGSRSDAGARRFRIT